MAIGPAPKPDEQPRDPSGDQSIEDDFGTETEGGASDDHLEKELMKLQKAICSGVSSSDLGRRRQEWARGYRAYNNQHSEGSKYKTSTYRTRAKNFVPKTRSSVKKNMVAGAGSLFATTDAISVTAENDADKAQQATATANHELLNYRLDRTNKRAGIPWMPICMKQLQTSRIAGVCFSKQYWEYEERLEEVKEEWLAENPEHPELRADVVGMNGLPMRARVIRDRPRVRKLPPEQAIIDLGADDDDIVQEGEFFIAQWPFKVSQIKAMQKRGHQHLGGGAWLDVPEGALKKAAEEYSATGARSARGRGSDPLSPNNTPSVSDLDMVWVHENFIKFDGEDYHFYTLGDHTLLSTPGLTEDHYPAFMGERPYVMGLGELEAFSPLPMSTVEALQPIQNEINDIRNLGIDTLKQGIAPMAVYKRGTSIDLRALKERGPDANIGVQTMEDLRFEAIPGPNPQAFAMHNALTVEFDELAGSFSQSSVTNNRGLGETARGMQLVNNSANSVQEFDLRVFVETYVEPVLRHLIMLEQYYETDETILALVGQKAQLYERFGVSEPIDAIIQGQVSARVNAGVGSTDPMQKIQKLAMANEMTMKIAQAMPGQIEPNAEELIGEIYGAAGYKAERFFKFTSPEEAKKNAPPPPEMLKAQVEQGRLELDKQKTADDSKEKKTRLAMDIADKKVGLQNTDRDFGLRAAGQNKQLLDEATGQAKEVMDPQQAREPLPAETAMMDASQQLVQIVTMLATSQQQQTNAITAILQQQQQTNAMIAEMLATAKAPKRIVRDAAGRVEGVEIEGQPMQPVIRGPDNRIEGI